MQTLINKIKPNDIWQHYKGKQYRILMVSCHSEDLSWYVVYETLHDNAVSRIWHRPLDIFLGTLEIDGAIVPRFTQVGEK